MPMPILAITDGTSNTILLGEIAGRPDVYRVGKKVSGTTEGAGWGDPLNGENWFAGSLFDGSGAQGPCLINCTNLTGRGLYSFHSGGCNLLLCDGSARFVPQGTSGKVIAFMVTRAKGEVIPDF
jgi:prepilin-type processing-associated H-X9-DG protein